MVFWSGGMNVCEVGEQRKANDVYGSKWAIPRVQIHMDDGQFGNGVQLMP